MKIIISNPCHENWEGMTLEEKGRFCSVCSKTVRDFTASSDRQVLKAFSSAKDDICDRFNITQLNRNLLYSDINSIFMKFAAGFMLTAGGLIAVNGQQATAQDSAKAKDLQEVMVTGYRTVKKSMFTGLGTVVPGDFINAKQEDKSSMLAEQMKGVTVNPPSKDSNNAIRIGGGSLVSGSSGEPLLIVDQKVVPLKVLEETDPQSIETLNILKGKDATALYGAKAIYGVILVTTKNNKSKRK